MERNRLFIKIEHKASELDDYYTTYTLAGQAKENTSRYVSNCQVLKLLVTLKRAIYCLCSQKPISDQLKRDVCGNPE